MNLVAIVLAYNEEKHIVRCINSIKKITNNIVVVDCFSTDETVTLAKNNGAVVLQNEWVNHSVQFNWALKKINQKYDWIIRVDADEYLTCDLCTEINTKLPNISKSVSGIYLRRNIIFQNSLLRYGGVSNLPVLRLFRNGEGICEDRWMDEHINIKGRKIYFSNDLIDHNLNSLEWWTDKHNQYSNKEALEILDLKYDILLRNRQNRKHNSRPKSWIKERVFIKLPHGYRSLLYFIYRYIILFGFLDGRSGFAFHFLQGFWYRYLVDAKVDEVNRYLDQHKNFSANQAVKKFLNIEL